MSGRLAGKVVVVTGAVHGLTAHGGVKSISDAVLPS